MKSLDFFLETPNLQELGSYRSKNFSATLLVLSHEALKKDPKEALPWAQALSSLPKELSDGVQKAVKSRRFRGKVHQHFVFDLTPAHRVVLAIVSQRSKSFDLLTTARQSLGPLLEIKPKSIAVALLSAPKIATQKKAAGLNQFASAFVAAWAAGVFKMPKYSGKKGDKKKKVEAKIPPLSLFVTGKPSKEFIDAVAHSADLTGATNLVRRLTQMAGNDLTPSRYVGLAMDLAAKCKLKSTFHSLTDLEKMGAGAFSAVSRASEDRGGGVLKIAYTPKAAKDAKHLVVAGKGICFDTGGANLKPGPYMFGMHGDMSGSAVALATVILAAKEQWPIKVTGVLGITDNMIGPKGFRPNDIVTAMNGKTIEVVDTDAEGRMILSDTLHIACQEEPDLLLDFATLTGSCVRALGTMYSGVFSHSTKLYSKAVRAGVNCGERVWPFPTDSDYGKILKSDVADIKQCRTGGGPDHIEAAYFLGQFVPAKVPWLHVDLSAVENDGGLAHVPTKVTGFGVRFATEMADFLLNEELP